MLGYCSNHRHGAGRCPQRQTRRDRRLQQGPLTNQLFGHLPDRVIACVLLLVSCDDAVILCGHLVSDTAVHLWLFVDQELTCRLVICVHTYLLMLVL